MPAGPFAKPLEHFLRQFRAAEESSALRKVRYPRKLKDAREGLIEPTTFLAEAYESFQVLMVSAVRVEPKVHPNDIEQLVHDLDGLVERRSGRVGCPALPIPPSPVVIGLEPVERNLRLTNVVPSDEGGDVPGPARPVRDDRGGIADFQLLTKRLKRD